MDKNLAVALTAFVGGLIALQAPINSTLGKRIGTLPAASVSFAIGTVVLVALALLFEAPDDEAGEVGEIVRNEMIAAFELDPPLAVDVGIGSNWLEAK